MKRILEVKKKIGTLSKNAKNPFFKSQYLDLNELLNHVEPILWDEGLLLLQPIIDNKVHSVIFDAETSNPLVESYMELPDLKDPQKMGSAITYYRRYTLKSLLGIAEQDDDGNKASKPEVKKKPILTIEGYNYLLEKGTATEVCRALNERDMSDEWQTKLDQILIDMAEDGSD